MTEKKSSGRQFEDLVRRILEANQFRIQSFGYQRADLGFDFIGTLANEMWAIEAKFYRTARAQASLLEAAASRLIIYALGAHAGKAMLVVSCILPAALRDSLEEKFSLVFLDRIELANWASKVPELVDELNALVEIDPSAPTESPPSRLPTSGTTRPLRPTALRADTKGRDLCSRLTSLKRGKNNWAAYEELCVAILKYLFPNDLHGWHRQHRTDDGLNRFDYVCRIRPTTDFWRFLIEHLDSRYILFEFKNYTGKIKQGQILTTEKYLLEKGLRRVAILFTRVGADDDALKMRQGAMREHGKLMVIIDDKLVCEMLHMKERGEDPTDRLFELADGFLLSLPR